MSEMPSELPHDVVGHEGVPHVSVHSIVKDLKLATFVQKV